MSQTRQEARLAQRKRTSNNALSYGAKAFRYAELFLLDHECDRHTDIHSAKRW